MSIKTGLRAALCAVALGLGAAPAAAQAPVAREDETYAIAREGYDYYVPLLLMDLTRRAQTTLHGDGAAPKVPVDGFWNWSQFPDATYRQIVAPNFDTLYAMTWLDLTNTPVTLGVPPRMDRYYVLPLMDMWTDVFAVLGTRTLGEAGGEFTIVGPDWRGTTPKGAQVIRAPTNLVWIIGRIQTNGPADYAHVRDLQKGFSLRRLGARPAAEVDLSFDAKTPPSRQLASLDADQFFSAAARLAGRHPAHLVDQPMLARLARIGFRPGEPYDLGKQPPFVRDAVRRAAADALSDLKHHAGDPVKVVDGWSYDPANIAVFGADYHQRALVALSGLGANRREDAVYPSADRDQSGKPLDGRKRYRLHFGKDQLPPTHAFWSLTAYDQDAFPIQTPQKRYAVGDRDPLVFNPDGSLDLYLGSQPPPPEREANWLPTSDAPFNVTLRIYSPTRAVLDGHWRVPPIRELDASSDLARP